MIPELLSKAKLTVIKLISRIMIVFGLLRPFLAITNRLAIKKKKGSHSPLLLVKRNSRFQILLYHRVNDENDMIFGGMPTKTFRGQMEILSKYFNVLPLEELVERAKQNDIPSNAVSITFDDGYRDNHEKAFAILKELGLPATIFLTTGPIESGTPLWHDVLFDAFRETSARSMLIDGREYNLKTWEDKRRALNVFRRHIRNFNPQSRDMAIQQLASELEVSRRYSGNGQKLNWPEIEEMSKENITFGAHTVTHPILTSLPLSEAMDEIIASKEVIEGRLKCPVRLFAYPNGGRDDFNEPIKQLLKEAGFMGAVTTLWGANGVHIDPFELRRMGIWDLDPQVSALKLAWYYFNS